MRDNICTDYVICMLIRFMTCINHACVLGVCLSYVIHIGCACAYVTNLTYTAVHIKYEM